MQNLSEQQRPNNLPMYSDGDVNKLLDTISRQKDDNRYLLREFDRIDKIAKALRVDNTCLQTANKALQERIQQLQQQIPHGSQ